MLLIDQWRPIAILVWVYIRVNPVENYSNEIISVSWRKGDFKDLMQFFRIIGCPDEILVISMGFEMGVGYGP